jgi:hypothetical protein
MAISISTGATVAIASTYGTAVNMTAITNANPAVATLAASHGVVVGDFIEITTSGWGRIQGRLFRVSVVATNDVTLEGLNTTSTAAYPATAGAGTIRRITAWTNLSQLQSVSISGGDQQYADTTAIDDLIQKQIPTTRNPYTVQMTAFFDPALTWWTAVRAAQAGGIPVGFRIALPSGNRTVCNGYWTLAEVPNVARDQPVTHQIDVAFAVDATPYAT